MTIADHSHDESKWPYPYHCVLDDGREAWASTPRAAEIAARQLPKPQPDLPL